MGSAFSRYATRTAFSIALTRDQSNMLLLLEKGYPEVQAFSRGPKGSRAVQHLSGLIRRGLVEHNPAMKFLGTPNVTVKWVYRLTEAGEHVCALLRLAGFEAETVKEEAGPCRT